MLNLIVLVLCLSLSGCLFETKCDPDPNNTKILKRIEIPREELKRRESDLNEDDNIDGYVGGDTAPDLDILNNDDNNTNDDLSNDEKEWIIV